MFNNYVITGLGSSEMYIIIFPSLTLSDFTYLGYVSVQFDTLPKAVL